MGARTPSSACLAFFTGSLTTAETTVSQLGTLDGLHARERVLKFVAADVSCADFPQTRGKVRRLTSAATEKGIFSERLSGPDDKLQQIREVLRAQPSLQALR